MFTGIIENTGKVISLRKEKNNLLIAMESSFANDLKIGQSVAHNGVCLTVISPPPSPRKEKAGERSNYYVTAVKETLDKTNLGVLKKGCVVNLERSLKIGDRLDGHFVQGHVDTTAICKEIKKEKGSWIFKFQIKKYKLKTIPLLIEKGSVCINGVSLTIVQVSPMEGEDMAFSVAIIPHTFKHTNFNMLKKGDWVNIEFDVLGKYIEKILSARLK